MDKQDKITLRLKEAIDQVRTDLARVEIWANALATYSARVPTQVGPGSMKTPVLGPRRALAFSASVTGAVPIVIPERGRKQYCQAHGLAYPNHPSTCSIFTVEK